MLAELIDNVREARILNRRDLSRLEAIDAQAADIDADAVSRVRARVLDRLAGGRGYLANLVSQLRSERIAISARLESLESAISAERSAIDEIRLLRRIDEITAQEAATRTAKAREVVQAARDDVAACRQKLAQIDAEMRHHAEESEG